MSEMIAEIDQSEFDNVPASVPLTMHDSNDALLEPIMSKEDVVDAIEAAIEEVEQTEIEPQQEEEPIIQTVDITEPIVNDVAEQPIAVESTHIAAANDDDEHVAVPHHASVASHDEVVHEIDSQEARDAILLAEEEAEDKQDDIEEIHRELEDASAATRKKQQQEALLRAIQEALSGTSGQSMEMFGLNGMDDYPQDEDYEEDEPDVPADTSMLAWLKSNILPSAPSASFFTYRSLQRNAKLMSLKAGRLAWNVSTAALLLLVPYVIAHANELAFVDQFRETNRLQELLNDAQGKGYEGLHSAPHGASGQPQVQQAHIAANAPAGYVAPPVNVSGIPSQ